MGSREDILRRLRAAAPPLRDLPETRHLAQRYPDLRAQFARALQDVGGRCVQIASREELGSELEKLEVHRTARRIASLVPGVPRADPSIDAAGDAHELADVDLAVVPGELAVAENGAVWITDRGLRHRVLPWIAQHLALVVSAELLVNDMHEAYERVQLGRWFGCFISGPSKTADIEQALVIGAHGPRSATVFLVG